MSKKHAGGRPPLFKSAEDMQEAIDVYMDFCHGKRDDEDLALPQIPTISGLAFALGMSTRALLNYEKKDEFLPTIKRAKQVVENAWESRLAGSASTGAIFWLKNNAGWKDKTEQDVTSGGKPIENTWVINPVTTNKDG